MQQMLYKVEQPVTIHLLWGSTLMHRSQIHSSGIRTKFTTQFYRGYHLSVCDYTHLKLNKVVVYI